MEISLNNATGNATGTPDGRAGAPDGRDRCRVNVHSKRGAGTGQWHPAGGTPRSAGTGAR